MKIKSQECYIKIRLCLDFYSSTVLFQFLGIGEVNKDNETNKLYM